ncbi:MAG: DUF4172 domain-containing protein [Bacteroidetes bacterium]|nr:DUF4172 domain-containing protein [Bacteroidota bacterium]
MVYNWQQSDWPVFQYDTSIFEEELLRFRIEDSHLSGMIKAVPGIEGVETLINLMVSEAIKTSEIEGEFLNRDEVVSSIRNNLGLETKHKLSKKSLAKGVGDLMFDVRQTFDEPLTEQKLYEWHNLLLSSEKDIKVGAWRDHEDPMQIVSGAYGKRKIHFEAPPSDRVPAEMKRFIKWFNETTPGEKSALSDAPVRSALVHLYFESIHPFEDGNGRIGRALAEKSLSQNVGRPVMLSLSTAIEKNKTQYYSELQKAQRNNTVTNWVKWFTNTILEAQKESYRMINFTIHKTRWYEQFKSNLNARQLKAMGRMFEEGPDGFVGGMNVRKYISITKASKATATRDLQMLLETGAVLSQGKARSTSYLLNLNL